MMGKRGTHLVALVQHKESTLDVYGSISNDLRCCLRGGSDFVHEEVELIGSFSFLQDGDYPVPPAPLPVTPWSSAPAMSNSYTHFGMRAGDKLAWDLICVCMRMPAFPHISLSLSVSLLFCYPVCLKMMCVDVCFACVSGETEREREGEGTETDSRVHAGGRACVCISYAAHVCRVDIVQSRVEGSCSAIFCNAAG
jgi:hypothetical protein